MLRVRIAGYLLANPGLFFRLYRWCISPIVIGFMAAVIGLFRTEIRDDKVLIIIVLLIIPVVSALGFVAARSLDAILDRSAARLKSWLADNFIEAAEGKGKGTVLARHVRSAAAFAAWARAEFPAYGGIECLDEIRVLLQDKLSRAREGDNA